MAGGLNNTASGDESAVTGGFSNGASGAASSWQVAGIRKDAFAAKHRIPVEQDKPRADRGRCLYTKACGGRD